MRRTTPLLCILFMIAAHFTNAQCPSWCVNTGNAYISAVPSCYGELYQIAVTGEYSTNSQGGQGSYTFNAAPGSTVSITFTSYCYSCSPDFYCCAYDGLGNCVDNSCYTCNCTNWNSDNTVTINVPEGPVCTISGTATATAPSAHGCNDGSISYSASTNACNGYSASLSGGYGIPGPGSITGLTAGTYYLIFDTNPSGCNDVIEVTVPNGPCASGSVVSSTGATSPACNDGTIMISEPVVCSYAQIQLWKGNSNVGSGGGWPGMFPATFDALAPGSYSVHLFIGDCEEIHPIVVGPACDVNATVSVQQEASGSVCHDGIIEVNVGTSSCGTYSAHVSWLDIDGTEYPVTWSGMLSVEEPAVFNNLPPGQFRVVTTLGSFYGEGLCEQVDTVTITSPGCAFPFSMATLQATAANSCADGSIIIQHPYSCTWSITVMRTDSTVVFGPSETFWYWGGDIEVPVNPGQYLVKAVGSTSTLPNGTGGNIPCVTWGNVEVTCEDQVMVAVRAFIEGPYSTSTGLMSDALRSAGLLPLHEPYTALGYPFPVGQGAETVDPWLLTITGPDAVVDWVLLELRSSSNPGSVASARCALVQRDGDVVDVDGVSPVTFNIPWGDFHVAIRHRNHLGCMTLDPIPLGSAVANVDFAATSTATWGTNARKTLGSTQVLWSGDVTFNRVIQYTGGGNDRDPILVRVGGSIPTNTATGYYQEDCTLDGEVKYTGVGNDRDPILVNIGGTIPTNTRTEPVP